MDGGPGVTLFNPSELNLNINNNQEDEEVEEAVEDVKRRDEVLDAQLENAFSDFSDEDGHNDDHIHSHCSSRAEVSHEGSHQGLPTYHINGLSDISEHSANNSGFHSSTSREIGNDNSDIEKQKKFSPSRSVPYKFVQVNGTTPEYMAGLGGRGDADQYHQMFKSNSSSEDSTKFQPIFPGITDQSKSSENDQAEAYRQAECNSVEQLQVLYEVRLHDIQRLSSQLEAERQETASHKRKMALLEAEKERAVLSRTEANNLLVASKEEIGQLQKNVHSLKQTVATLEEEKEKNEEMVELTKLRIQELEQRITLMERCDPTKSIVKQTDIMVKELKQKHQQEVQLLQRQIESVNKKLQDREEECRSLEQKVSELQRTHEQMLVEKADTINQLARSLEESQAQCRQLMAANITADNVRLQSQLEEALREKEKLNETINTLQAECSLMKADLAQYESVSRLTLPHSNSSSDETDSIIQLGLSSRTSKKSSLISRDISTKLKDELNRALMNQKTKRAEIARLQDIIAAKEKQIQEMTLQERKYLAQTETLHEQMNKMMSELTLLQEKKPKESDSERKAEEISNLRARVADLQNEKNSLERENQEIQQRFQQLKKEFEQEKNQELSSYNKEYMKFHDETLAKVRKEVEEEAEMKVKECSIRLEQSLRELSEVKELYVEVCTAKEQVTMSLNEANAQLEQMSAERDRLAEEVQTKSAMCDQLARQLNKTSDEGLRAELDRCVEVRDQLARQVNTFKRENDLLMAEIQRLKTESTSRSPSKNENNLAAECERLREELSVMSARHTQELSCVRTELQSARDRVIQLEKSTRLQFETEIKSLRQDKDMWKTKCDEKEVQIKKLIECRKRPPTMISTATETDAVQDVDMQQIEERHRRELARCREEYTNTLLVMEQAHHEALMSARNKNKEELERLQEEHQLVLGAIRRQHEADLQAVEERTKQITIKFFTEEVRKLEAKHIEEAGHRVDPAVVQTMHEALLSRTQEIESLKQSLSALQRQLDADRNNASQMMLQWTQEIKNIQGELKLKEAIIDDQRSKLEKAQTMARKYRNKLIKTNREITSQYMSKCAEYKNKMQQIIEENEKEVYEKIRQMENVYEQREKELKKKISKKDPIS